MEEEEVQEPQKIHRIFVEYCDQCNVPIGYCKYFGHIRPVEHPEEEEQDISKPEKENGEEEEEEEAFEEDYEPMPQQIIQIKGPKKNSKKNNIEITVKSRTKRKNTTTIAHLDDWDVDTKEFSKNVQKKMAIGCSTKKDQKGTRIVIQGDVTRQIMEIIITQYHVPKANIQVIRKQKKKPKQPGAH